MPGRKLTVIVLNDIPDPYPLPEGLDYFDKQINSWFRALNFWAHYKGDALPDLVVADVRFDHDFSSPLSRVRFADPEPNPLPTGLSHLKPLGVLARVGGRIVGIGIFTGSPTHWERLTRASAPQDQCMGYLAAHELGELAAILGEKGLVAEVVETNSFDPLWKWLEVSTGSISPEAVKIALSNYRRRLLALASPAGGELPQVFVMPDDFAAVMCWCEEMARDREDRPPLAGDSDQALTLTYKDGTRDSILISSLFSDVDDITTRPLDAQFFETAPFHAGALGAEEEWQEFDRKGQPFIGKFLSRLGTLRSAYEEAARIVEAFPCLPPESRGSGDALASCDDDTGLHLLGTESPAKLGGHLTRKGDDPLVAGLVIVFQLVRIEKAVFDLWEKHYTSYLWEPRSCQWPSDKINYERSLRNALHLLLNAVRPLLSSETGSAGPHPTESRAHEAPGDAVAQDDHFTRGDVLEEIIDAELPWPWLPELRAKDAETEWCRWHFQRLVDARILKVMPDDTYKLIAPGAHMPTPPLPKTLPKKSGSIYDALGLAMEGDDSDPEAGEDAEKKFTLRTWLRTSFGYRDDAHTLFRMLYHAFVRHGAEEPEVPEWNEEHQRAQRRKRRGEDSQKRTRIKEQLGKYFLDQLEAGRAPGWLLALCGQYAEERLLWRDKITWPNWLQRKL